jgi:pimeloyl-ACP methyl ester carboxylesterase
MLFCEYGNCGHPTIVLLHGGGLAPWSMADVISILQTSYHVVAVTIDGHGEDYAATFISIEDSASKLTAYIDERLNGFVFAIGGLSLGAQIAAEVLSRRKNIAQFAVLESALVLPLKGTKLLTVPAYQLCYGLIKKRWFAKAQAKELCIPDDMFEPYYRDSARMTKDTLVSMILSNGTYSVKEGLRKTQSKVLIIVGEKELPIMRKSAEALRGSIPCSRLYTAPGMKHGELSLLNAEKYCRLICDHFTA